jgi:hypothetical protein
VTSADSSVEIGTASHPVRAGKVLLFFLEWQVKYVPEEIEWPRLLGAAHRAFSMLCLARTSMTGLAS